MSASMRQDFISHVHELARSKLVSIYTLGMLFLMGLLGISLRGERRPMIYNLNSKVASMEGWEYVTPDRLHTTDVNFPPVSTKYSESQGLELPQSNTPETWTPDWYNQTDIQALLQRRSERVRSICERRESLVGKAMETAYSYKYNLKNDGRILQEEEHKLAICFTPKAGSTYWRALLSEIARHNRWKRRPEMNSVPNYWSKREHKQLWTTFAVTRNPWHRFFSVYVEKQLVPGRERLKFIRNCKGFVRMAGRYLTFEEFLGCAVLQMESGFYNRHWEPVFRRCDICSHPYTFISLENMKVEAEFLMKLVAIKNGQEIMEKVRSTTIRNVEKKKLSSSYQDNYRNLTDQSLITRFAQFYEVEFEMFGYPRTPFASAIG